MRMPRYGLLLSIPVFKKQSVSACLIHWMVLNTFSLLTINVVSRPTRLTRAFHLSVSLPSWIRQVSMLDWACQVSDRDFWLFDNSKLPSNRILIIGSPWWAPASPPPNLHMSLIFSIIYTLKSFLTLSRLFIQPMMGIHEIALCSWCSNLLVHSPKWPLSIHSGPSWLVHSAHSMLELIRL